MSDLDIYASTILPRLADGPKTVEQLGVSRGAIRVLLRNGLIRPKMKPWLNSAGRVIGAIEQWQVATPPTPRPPRVDCAVIDFAEWGIN